MSAEQEGHEFGGHWKAALRGDYIAAVELDGETPTITIRAARLIPLEVRKLGKDEREGETAAKKDKLVLFAEGESRGWVLNRTNATCLAAMFGDTVAGWVGKRVTICAEMVQVGPKKDLGIRIVGSPDIDRTVRAKIELPRRKPLFRDLVPTGQTAARPKADALDAALRAAGCKAREDAVAVVAYLGCDRGAKLPTDPQERAELAAQVADEAGRRPPGLLLDDARAWMLEGE